MIETSLAPDHRRETVQPGEDLNLSIEFPFGSDGSEERSSRCLSRLSARTAGSRGGTNRLQGLFYNIAPVNGEQQQTCPFPEDWQFGLVPDVIANDDDLD